MSHHKDCKILPTYDGSLSDFLIAISYSQTKYEEVAYKMADIDDVPIAINLATDADMVVMVKYKTIHLTPLSQDAREVMISKEDFIIEEVADENSDEARAISILQKIQEIYPI